MEKYVLGVDIGGTKIAAGMVSHKGVLGYKTVCPTRAAEGLKVSLAAVYRSIEEVLHKSGVKEKQITGIGVCAPGPLDPLKGIVHNPPNLPFWRELKLAELLQRRYGKTVKIENDANAAGIAEMIWGSAKGYKHIFYVTVSTGIGTAVIIDGKIYHGKNGMAGEGGHVTINYDAFLEKCNCGNIGCIEALASGVYAVKRLRREAVSSSRAGRALIKMGVSKPDFSYIGLTKAAKKGDKTAMAAVAEQGRILGISLGSMINILDPEIIVVGGGVSANWKLLSPEIKKNIPKHSINVFAGKTPVVRAKLRKDVGILGASSILL